MPKTGVPAAAQQHGLDAALTQPLEVGDRVLRARQHDEVGLAQVYRALHVAHAHTVYGVERDEVREVRHLGKADDRDVHELLGAADGKAVRHAVFVVDVEQRVRHDARDGNAAALTQDVEPRVEDGLVAAELVHDEPLHHGALVVLEQHERAEQLREHAAAVDVTGQQHGAFGHARHAHVHDVVVF